jgi:hypothetical protein
MARLIIMASIDFKSCYTRDLSVGGDARSWMVVLEETA